MPRNQNMGKKAGVGIWAEGGSGNDTLTGTEARDTFVLRADSGHDVVTNFDVSNPDLIMLDSQTGIYDGQLGSIWAGRLADGYDIYNSRGTHVAVVHEEDFNGDGLLDTQFAMDSGATLTLLGVLASQLSGQSILGG